MYLNYTMASFHSFIHAIYMQPDAHIEVKAEIKTILYSKNTNNSVS
jgi:hypothetical protein